jgi:hypothetical protein
MHGQERHHLLAQRIAAVADVLIALVVDPVEAMRLRIFPQVDARHAPAAAAAAPPASAGALQLGHRRQAFRPGAAQQLQQKRFGLVVLLVRGQQKIGVERGENLLALAPRGRLDAGRVVARDLHVMKCQFNGMRSAKPGAESSPVVGMGRQAMVHMHGPQFEWIEVAQRQQGMQQNHRVESARKRQHQPRMRRDVAGKTRRHDCGDRFIWQELP